MSVIVSSLIGCLLLGIAFCPFLAPAAEGMLSGTGITGIPAFNALSGIDWWRSLGFLEYPNGAAAVFVALFLASLLFFSAQQAEKRADDGGVLGNARIKTGSEVLKGSAT